MHPSVLLFIVGIGMILAVIGAARGHSGQAGLSLLCAGIGLIGLVFVAPNLTGDTVIVDALSWILFILGTLGLLASTLPRGGQGGDL